MKISLNWLKNYLDIDHTPEKIASILTSIGLEVEGWETVESVKGGLKGVIVAEVMACEQHPNADRLRVTKVETGTGDLLSVVCGAPNVAKGQKVLLATIGATLYPVDATESLTIKESKIRGELSQGMLCAEDELGLGHSHAGILVLPNDIKVGTPAADYFKLEQDTVFEIGLTPNRADATNHIGVARDLAASLSTQEGLEVALKLPDAHLFKEDENSFQVSVVVEDFEACPRYTGLTISGVKVGESPDWLKKRLLSVGIRPINNVVDVTNFVRAEYGQPLHAFDAEKIAGCLVNVRFCKEGTPFLALDGNEYKLSENDLMICDGNNVPLCMAGVFGGKTSGVSDTTTEIFLESAHFNGQYIRKSMLRHNLRTDAAWAFEKGTDPNICVTALRRAAMLIKELAGGKITSRINDIYPSPIESPRIPVLYAHINRLTGMVMPHSVVKSILQSLDIHIENENDKGFVAIVPTNKPDVTREADIIEEILRIYGLDNVPVPEQMRISMEINPQPDVNEVKEKIAEMLAAAGFMEGMSLSLSNAKYYSEWMDAAPETLVQVHNTANQGLDTLRASMIFSGLEAILHNQNRQNADLRLFEFGKVYSRKEQKFTESNRLALFLTGAFQGENWQPAAKKQVDFYTLKAIVHHIFQKLGIKKYQERITENNLYRFCVTYHVGEVVLLEMGQLNASMVKKMDIKNDVFAAELHWDNLFKQHARTKVKFEEISKFPVVRRDLALVIDESTEFATLKSLAQKSAGSLLRQVNLFDVYRNPEQLGVGKKSYAISFLFENKEKTLQDKEIDKLLNDIQKTLETKCGAKVRN